MRTVARSRMPLLVVLFSALAVPVFQIGGVAQAKDAPPSAKADPLLPNDTSLVLVVEVKQILESPVFKKNLLEDAQKALKANDEASKIFGALGFDPFKDLVRVTLAINDISADAKGLLIARGKFDKDKFEAKAETESKEKKDLIKVHTEGGHKIFEVTVADQPKPTFVGVVDNSAIVASGEKSFVVDAFAKATASGAQIKPEMAKVIEGAEEGCLWLAVPGSALSKSDLASEEKMKATVAKIENVTASVRIAKDFKISVTIAAKSEANAKELSEDIKEGLNSGKGMVAFLASQQKELAPLVDLVNAVKVAVEGKKLTIKAEMNEEMIDKAHAARKGQ
jgi:hypothetical protein